jgi:hypothetical protein
MTTSELLDAAGRRRSPATMPGHNRRRPRRNEGLRYPPDPPAVEVIVAVVRCAGESSFGLRTRALIVCAVASWAAHPRSSGARRERPRPRSRRSPGPPRQGRQAARSRHGRVGLATSSTLARRSRRAAGGALLCIISGRTAGRSCAAPAARCCLRQLAVQAGVRRRFAPHQLRQAHAVEMAREGLALNVIQRQQRDHRDRSRPARADTAGERRPSVAARHLAAPVTPPLAREGGHAPPGVPEPRETGGPAREHGPPLGLVRCDSRPAALRGCCLCLVATAMVLELSPIGSSHASAPCLCTEHDGSGRVVLRCGPLQSSRVDLCAAQTHAQRPP